MADARPFHWEYVPEPVVHELFRVEGGRPLTGTVQISGSKNTALKLFAAATLTGERCRFTNVPEIEDVRVMAETADMASEIDLEKAQEARREAERALESGYHEGADLSLARAALQQALLRERLAQRRHREGPRHRG